MIPSVAFYTPSYLCLEIQTGSACAPLRLFTFHVAGNRQRGYTAVGGSNNYLVGVIFPQVSYCEDAGDICLAFHICDNITGGVSLDADRYQ